MQKYKCAQQSRAKELEDGAQMKRLGKINQFR